MKLGIGIGWRPEIAAEVEALSGIDWVEAVAENLCADHLPDSLVRLRQRGVRVVPHGVALGLGGAGRPDRSRLAALAARAELLGAPLVTEHIAFVRSRGAAAGPPGLEAGHLLPVPRTWDALDVLCENVRVAQDSLPAPLALENIAALVSWPDEELSEGQFLAELVERTGVRLLIDVANLHTNHVNLGQDPAKALDMLPVEAIAYVHVAGGVEKDGVWHDTHAHPVTAPVLDVLTRLRSRVDPPGVLLERDDAFPPAAELAAELDAIRAVVRAPHPPAAVRRAVDALPEAGTLPVPVARAAVPGARPAADPYPAAAPAARPAATGQAPDTPARVPRRRTARPEDARPEGARERLAVAQGGLLAALVAGGPAPEGFDPWRLRVQSRALAAKRADVVARVAPELPDILGDGYRAAFLAYADGRPMPGGHRRDALDFAAHLLATGGPANPGARRRLAHWWRDRAAARPPRRATRLVRAARALLVRT
ncbi:DUF692 family multinuclear iron-containing protein [Streptomyces pratensis]|uniref:multinuclear nonheme iron-dependent oxidase n=1 Tax=Streptomyces pratensis TaxID=1169025 RepID=UPI00301774FA